MTDRDEKTPVRQLSPLATTTDVANAFDALTSNRPYRDKISVGEAMAYLKEQAGVLFDPDIVSTFEKVLTKIDLEAPSS